MYLIFELHCICAKELKMYFIIFDIVLNVLNILIALYFCAGTSHLFYYILYSFKFT